MKASWMHPELVQTGTGAERHRGHSQAVASTWVPPWEQGGQEAEDEGPQGAGVATPSLAITLRDRCHLPVTTGSG